MKTRNDLISALEKFASLHRIVGFSVDFSVDYDSRRRTLLRSRINVPVSMHRRAELERFLLLCGFEVNENYFPGAGVVEVQVEYFSRKKAA